MADRHSVLDDLPGLDTLSPATRQALVDRGREVRIPAGWAPIHESEPADKAYLVLSGHLCVMSGGREVASLGPGSLAGEMGLVDHRLRNARITASDPVLVLAWPKSDFQRLRGELADFEELVQATTQQRHQVNDES